jgi:hypothetical protein
MAGNGGKQNIPEHQKNLVPAKVQKKQLYGQAIPKSNQVFFHMPGLFVGQVQ